MVFLLKQILISELRNFKNQISCLGTSFILNESESLFYAEDENSAHITTTGSSRGVSQL